MELPKINSKTTKTELIEIIKQQTALLNERKSQTINTKQAEQQEKTAATLTAASCCCANLEEFEQNFLQIIEDYKTAANEFTTMKAAVAEEETRLSQLHNIEKELLDLEAIQNARITMQEENKLDLAAMKRDHDAKLNQAIFDYNAQVDALKRQYNDLRIELDRKHQREEEDYQYNLTKTRREEQNRFMQELEDERANFYEEADAKDARLSELAKQLKDREIDVTARESAMDELETRAAEGYETGYKEGKAEAGKEWSFEKRALEAKFDKETAMLNQTIAFQGNTISALEKQVAALTAQLETAHAQKQDLATKMVEAGSKQSVVYVPSTGSDVDVKRK